MRDIIRSERQMQKVMTTKLARARAMLQRSKWDKTVDKKEYEWAAGYNPIASNYEIR